MKEESRRNVLNQLSSTGNGQKRREGCRDTGALVLCANNLSRGPSSIAFVFPAQARSVPPPPRQICSKISGLEAKFVPYFHVCPYFALMRPRPLSLRRPIFEASHFCPTASTSSSPGRFGGCERGERVREWTGARWRGWAGEQGCATLPCIANLESLYHITNTGGGEEESARRGKGGRAFIDDLIFRPVRKVCRPQRKIDGGVCPRL